MSDLLRSFVCLPLQHDLARRVESWIGELRRVAPRIRWVAGDQLHVTLKFLGEVSFVTVAELARHLQRELTRTPLAAPELVLGPPGAFPHLRDPRTLWLGIKDKLEGARRVAELVETAAEAAGLPRERRSFLPHVTLGRGRTGEDFPVALLDALARSPVTGSPWVASQILIMKSELRPQGPRYEIMGEFPLRPSCRSNSPL